MVKGFQQKNGVDFDEICAHVVKMVSIRTMLSIVASMDLKVEQLDVVVPFGSGSLRESDGKRWGFELGEGRILRQLRI